MTTRHIVVLPYDEKWAWAFGDIKAELGAALGGLALAIEHVGSTSVPGLAAKPIIDIDVVVRRTDMVAAIQALATIGYEHEGNGGIEDREMFKYSGKEHLMEHHLYVCPEDSAELKRHILFRDYLRAHPDAVQAYGQIKKEAAELYPHDIDSYINHKGTVIEKIYRELGLNSTGGCQL